MSKYYKAEDVIRKRAEDLADTSYWEYGNPKNVDEWIKVAEMEFKDLPTIEVSEDCISRVDLRRSLARPLENNNADEMYWKGWHDCTVAVETRIADAPSVAPTADNLTAVEDCISRAKALEIYSDLYWMDERLLNFKDELDKVYEELRNAPSVVPSRAEGEWISKHNGYWTCSECGLSFLFYAKGNYCPNCGAKMKGADDGRNAD